MEEGRHAKNNVYEESQDTVDVYTNGWQCRLNILSKSGADVATTADAVRAASDVPPALVPEIQTGSCSQENAGESFEFDAEPESL